MNSIIDGFQWLSPFPTHKRGAKSMNGKERLLSSTDNDSESSSITELEAQEDHRKTYHRRSHVQHLFFKTIIFALAVTGFVTLVHQAWTTFHPAQARSCNCGETVSEAISRGCKYDSLAAAWLPDWCRDDELLAEFETLGPNPDGSWDYYADRDKNRTLSLHEVSILPEIGGHFFTTHGWHLVHCAFYWKKMFRANSRGVTIEKRYNHMMHLNHCQKMFLARDPLSKMAAEAGVALHSDVLVVSHKDHNMGNAEHEGGKAVGANIVKGEDY